MGWWYRALMMGRIFKIIIALMGIAAREIFFQNTSFRRLGLHSELLIRWPTGFLQADRG